MSTIEVYEPAMCCSTGVCGTDVAQELVTFSADLARFNRAGEPAVFAANEAVRQFLQVAGSEGLPLVMVDGVTAMTGRYPARDQLTRWAGLVPVPAGRIEIDLAQDTGGCCGGSDSGCC